MGDGVGVGVGAGLLAAGVTDTTVARTGAAFTPSPPAGEGWGEGDAAITVAIVAVVGAGILGAVLTAAGAL